MQSRSSRFAKLTRELPLLVTLLFWSPSAFSEECSKAFFNDLREQTNEANLYHEPCAFYEVPVKMDVQSMCRLCKPFRQRVEALATKVQGHMSCFRDPAKKRALSGLFNERAILRKMMAKCG